MKVKAKRKISDKKRLDWMIENKAAVMSKETIYGYKMYWVTGFYAMYDFKTPRQAIDAAMRSAK